MNRMYAAAAYDDIINSQVWGNDSTTRFMFLFSGVNNLFEVGLQVNWYQQLQSLQLGQLR